jgi:non-ribosomal peptide synthetase component F
MSVHDLIRAQAIATPDATAIVAGDKQYSYKELDARSERLAYLLRATGAGKDVPVGFACGLPVTRP